MGFSGWALVIGGGFFVLLIAFLIWARHEALRG